MRMIKVAPSILSGDFAALGQTVRTAEQWGADYIHFDVMDGLYVPNLTFGMPMCRAIRPYTTLPIDAHLMIVQPERYVEQFCACGADIVTFHPETCDDVQSTLDLIHVKGKRCGLVLNPDKGVEWIAPYMQTVDLVLLMGVYPGFGGQTFVSEVLDKIVTVKQMIEASGRPIELELDGGLTLQNAAEMVNRGVNVLVGGSCIFGADNPQKAVATLKALGDC